jgi:hypothetical protein
MVLCRDYGCHEELAGVFSLEHRLNTSAASVSGFSTRQITSSRLSYISVSYDLLCVSFYNSL